MSDQDWLLRMSEAVLVVSLIELVWLMTRRPSGPSGLLPNLMAGISLVLALRLVLGGAGPLWIGVCLASAGICHLVDLRARWRRSVVSFPLRRQQP